MDIGILLNFLCEGDIELKVKVFDNTSCHMNYHHHNDVLSLQRRWRVTVEATSVGFWMFYHRNEKGVDIQNTSLGDWVFFLRNEVGVDAQNASLGDWVFFLHSEESRGEPSQPTN
jgi:hypothetical protein